jgi:hypothetical protein
VFRDGFRSDLGECGFDLVFLLCVRA